MTPSTKARDSSSSNTIGSAFLSAIRAACIAWRDRPAWQAMMVRGMLKDFSWAASRSGVYRACMARCIFCRGLSESNILRTRITWQAANTLNFTDATLEQEVLKSEQSRSWSIFGPNGADRAAR